MSKSPYPKQEAAARKKMSKAMRTAAPQGGEDSSLDTIKASELLSRYPRKIQKKAGALLKSLKKNMAVKKVKRTAKHARRSGPGLPTVEASPQVVHPEGKRWIEVNKRHIQAQNKMKKKR
jgi:hypothetical protein